MLSVCVFARSRVRVYVQISCALHDHSCTLHVQLVYTCVGVLLCAVFLLGEKCNSSSSSRQVVHKDIDEMSFSVWFITKAASCIQTRGSVVVLFKVESKNAVKVRKFQMPKKEKTK